MRKKLLQHAEQTSLYNFIILRKKETPTQVFSSENCETFKNNGKNNKLAIFSIVTLLLLLLLLHLMLTR